MTRIRQPLPAYIGPRGDVGASSPSTGPAAPKTDYVEPRGGPTWQPKARVQAPKVRNFDDINDYKSDGAFIGGDGKTYPKSTPLDQVPPLLPNNGAQVKEKVVYVNGIMTDVALHKKSMQALANTGAAVVGIHNATKGMVLDLAQCVTDKLDLRLAKNEAVTTTADAVYDSLKKGTPVTLVGHSQGALVVSRALSDVQRRLVLEDGLSPADALKKLGMVKVETYGGASMNFPDGPTYTHYVNKFDLVPMLSGVGSGLGHAGEGAVIRSFSEIGSPKDLPPLSDGIANFFARLVDRVDHGADDIYFKHRGK